METFPRAGIFNYNANSFLWGFGGTYETATTLNFLGSMTIDAPAALAIAAVSLESATVNVAGTISSTARSGAIVTLPVPVPPGEPQPTGPVDELIAAGAILGDARVTFAGVVRAQIEGGGTIGAFSALADAYVTASGVMISERGFALRTQAAASDAHSVTSGLIEAHGGECAIMVEGRENSFVTNRAAVLTGGDHVDGILATARVDLTFTGDRVAALANSNVTVTNSGTLCTTGDGIRAEAQGTIEIRTDASTPMASASMSATSTVATGSAGRSSTRKVFWKALPAELSSQAISPQQPSTSLAWSRAAAARRSRRMQATTAFM
ncbi:hypothetical protein [Rhizobium sp. FKY42]|uniref:hypothetical protein n=1 Tax=Rhizobium sp. FKY42 TaxID=2562310 RepID=UPI0010BFFF8F|nr:hypothetical protein [Rhizobium sp. FKY42]